MMSSGAQSMLVLVLMIAISMHSDPRSLVNSNIIEASFVQIQSSRIGSEGIKSNKETCTLCEDFTARTVKYFSANETQFDIIIILHHACSQAHGFKHECKKLVDCYAPLFFMEIASIQPQLFCKKINLCGDMMISISNAQNHDDTCTICHRVVLELLTKLLDPDTQDVDDSSLRVIGVDTLLLDSCLGNFDPAVSLGNVEGVLNVDRLGLIDIFSAVEVCDYLSTEVLNSGAGYLVAYSSVDDDSHLTDNLLSTSNVSFGTDLVCTNMFEVLGHDDYSDEVHVSDENLNKFSDEIVLPLAMVYSISLALVRLIDSDRISNEVSDGYVEIFENNGDLVSGKVVDSFSDSFVEHVSVSNLHRKSCYDIFLHGDDVKNGCSNLVDERSSSDLVFFDNGSLVHVHVSNDVGGLGCSLVQDVGGCSISVTDMKK